MVQFHVNQALAVNDVADSATLSSLSSVLVR